MYLLLAAVIFIPLKWQIISMPLKVMPEVKSSYDAIEKAASKRKIAWISITFGPGTQAENRTQIEVLIRHLFNADVPFILLCWDQQGTRIAEQTAEDLAKELNKEEGVDWASTGFRPGYIMQFIKAAIEDMNKTLEKDRNGEPFADLPITKGRTIEDVGLVIEATPAGTVPAWISFLGQPRQKPIIYCPTAVMVPEGYNYVDTKQVCGMLPGLIGAAQYDQLMIEKGRLKDKGFAHRASDALSMSHALIIVLIILGNLGYFLSRRQGARG